jgi:gluconokinase
MIIILMGTTGAGKTTAGEILARELGWEFADADNFHSAANVEKMSKAIPLTDEDRKPWLDALRAKIEGWIARGENGILACSALKKSYRDELSVGPQVKWVYLRGSFEEISKRVAERKGHYAKEGLVASQFAALEEPSDALVVDVNRTPEEIVAEIRQRLGLR